MKIEIFGAEWCNPCKRTKQLCETKGLPYTFYDISAEPESLEKIKQYLGKEPKSIPQVFVDGKLVGGSTEFSKFISES